MATLLLRCVAPLQSWGLSSRFDERDTGTEPSKSGILGLLCAALGRDRHEPIGDLCALRMGVRVDSPGLLVRDYHTVLDVLNASGRKKDTVVTKRYYLADAAFWVGLEGDRDLLDACQAALGTPRWPLFLGRKSCPPSMPVHLPEGVVDEDLVPALRKCPVLRPVEDGGALRLLIEDPAGMLVRLDQPAGPFSERRFMSRHLSEEFVTCS